MNKEILIADTPNMLTKKGIPFLPVLLGAMVLLSGCMIPSSRIPSSQQIVDQMDVTFAISKEEAKSAQYPPKPADFREEVKGYLKFRLKDSDSAIYQNWILGKAL